MKTRDLTRAAMAAEMKAGRAQLNCVLDPEASNVTLDTLTRAPRCWPGVKLEMV